MTFSSVFGHVWFAVVGGGFLLLGLWEATFGASKVSEAAARVEHLVPHTAEFDDAPGQGDNRREVLIEGRIDKRNRTRFRDLVAYVREEFRVTGEQMEWHEDECETPPLFVAVSDGVVTITTYKLEAPQHTLMWSSTRGEWGTRGDSEYVSGVTKRYRGLRVGDTVTAVGTIVVGRKGPALEADFVYGGSRQEYIVTTRRDAATMPWLGGIFALAGFLILVFTFYPRSKDSYST